MRGRKATRGILTTMASGLGLGRHDPAAVFAGVMARFRDHALKLFDKHGITSIGYWTPIENPREIADVRLWWAMSDRDGERGPFSAKSRDHFQMTYERLAPDRWRVDLGSDRHVYRFWIEYDETGVVAAFADVVGDAGESFEHCRVTRGTLAARKIFGAPVGIRDFEVTCIDAEGSQRSGNMIDSAE